jgi:hypothetical protein
MNCPECGVWSEVLETRRKIVRRRECANGHRFTTIETLQKVTKKETFQSIVTNLSQNVTLTKEPLCNTK